MNLSSEAAVLDDFKITSHLRSEEEEDFLFFSEFNVVSDPTPTSVPPPPSFQLGAINTSLVISAGQKAYLHCLVRNMGDRAVSGIV